jgi:hypothetical protein
MVSKLLAGGPAYIASQAVLFKMVTLEGTLQPTARIKNLVEQAWANAAMRPWALKRDPYNSRAEVDEGPRKMGNARPEISPRIPRHP